MTMQQRATAGDPDGAAMSGDGSTWAVHFPGNLRWSNAMQIVKGMAPYGAIARLRTRRRGRRRVIQWGNPRDAAISRQTAKEQGGGPCVGYFERGRSYAPCSPLRR